MWSEYLKTQQMREKERWKFMKMPALLFYQVSAIDPEITNFKCLISCFCVGVWLGFVFIALPKANKTLNYLFWGISSGGKPRSFSKDWGENTSLSWTVVKEDSAHLVLRYLSMSSSFMLYLTWVAVSVMAVDCKQSLCQIYMSKMQYWTDVLLNGFYLDCSDLLLEGVG